MQLEIRSPKTNDEWEEYYGLRYRVMNKPAGYSRSSVHDEKDPKSFHIAAFNNAKIVGVGRLHYDNDLSKGYIRFMAVDVKFQSKGIGSQILTKLEEIAREHGSKLLKLKAREQAIGFYQKNGYKLGGKCKEKFFKTPHWNMSKEI